ncbi:MAG: hypothetical protein V7K40_33340 [Nostoc sp.]|uniref:hypothetical protein n=1 Tax=Nostoc sp. TaxID=1180 RepID=UPI002FFAF3B2
MLTATRDNDLITALIESFGKRTTDAACAASDEDGVVREIHRYFSCKDVKMNDVRVC